MCPELITRIPVILLPQGLHKRLWDGMILTDISSNARTYLQQYITKKDPALNFQKPREWFDLQNKKKT